METKQLLINSVKNWVKLDNELKELQKQLNIRKNEKKETSNTLMDIMRENDIDCFDLTDGQICYSKKNVKKPITKKMLQEVLSKYYKDDALEAEKVNDFIIKNREESVKESITRKLTAKTKND